MLKPFYFDRADNIVETCFGKVRGAKYDGMYVFKGIPYAEAERFHAPHAPKKWNNIYDCTVYGCVSPLLHFMPPRGDHLLIPHQYWVQGENCQNLNVWTGSINSDVRKPVLVWIHGGGFSDGSSIEAPFYNGLNFAKHNDCVFVSLNHRLNIFGYLDVSSYGEEYYNSGNNGQMDLIEALKWVRDNIGKFGGDPDNVTIMGQSGGGGKVSTLLSMPAADGLYHKAVIMSGILSLHDAEVLDEPRECVEAMMRFLGCKDIKELEKVPFTALAYAYWTLSPELRKQGKCVGCLPYRNGEFVGNPFHVGFRQETIHIPLVIGSVFGEGNSFVNRGIRRDSITEEEGKKLIVDKVGEDEANRLIKLFKEAYPKRNPADILFCDATFREPTSRYAKQRAAEGGKVWTYMYALDSSIDSTRTPWHSIDIPLIFDNADTAPASVNREHTEEIQKIMVESLGQFMRTGDPNLPEGLRWDPVTEDRECTMIYEEKPRTAVNFDRALMPELIKNAAALGNGAGFNPSTDY